MKLVFSTIRILGRPEPLIDEIDKIQPRMDGLTILISLSQEFGWAFQISVAIPTYAEHDDHFASMLTTLVNSVADQIHTRVEQRDTNGSG